jgi:hypothetical protein
MYYARNAGLIIALALAGCGVDTPDLPATSDYHATQVAEIGGGDGEGALTDVFGVAVSPEQHVFLSEPPLARVVEFDQEGQFIRVVGGRGRGPGEFQVPGGLFWRGDSLAVTDFTSGISLFAPDGSFLERISFVVNVPGTPFGGRPVLPLADGSIGVVVPPETSETDPGDETWMKASRTGAVLDTLALLSMRGRTFSFRAKGRGQMGTHPLAWAPIIAVPPSGESFVIVERSPATTSTGSRFRVLRMNLDGDTIASAQIAYVPVPVSDAMVDSIVRGMAGRMAERFGMSPSALAGEIKDQLDWPPYVPPVSTVLVGDDGSVWIERKPWKDGSARWEILDESFAEVGAVALPVDLEPKVVSRGELWAVQKDSLDVPHLLRFGIHKGAE